MLSLDVQGAPVNTLSLGLAEEMRTVFDDIERDSSITAAILISGKSDNFIAGADIEQFLEFKAAEEAEQASYTGQKMRSRLERLRVPVVAAIHGACLGGGLETTLACAWRIATEHPKTVLGLPEVQLGLIPGTGGTQRLPRLIGLPAALDMILRGRNVRPRKAMKMGLVDEVVHPAILLDVALQRARELGAGTRQRSKGRLERGAEGLLVERNRVGRTLVLKRARQSVMQQTHGQYPAPLAALDVIRTGYEESIDAGFREESRRFGQLAMTEVSRQLIFLFFATNSLKKDPGVAAPAPETSSRARRRTATRPRSRRARTPRPRSRRANRSPRASRIRRPPRRRTRRGCGIKAPPCWAYLPEPRDRALPHRDSGRAAGRPPRPPRTDALA